MPSPSGVDETLGGDPPGRRGAQSHPTLSQCHGNAPRGVFRPLHSDKPMVNRTRKTDFIPLGNGHSVGTVFTEDGAQVFDFGKDNRVFGENGENRSANVSTASGNVTLTPDQSGSTVRVGATASRTATLPAAADCKGCRFRLFVDGLASSGAGHSFVPASGDGIGGAGLTYTDDQDLLLAVASDAVGDHVEVESDGVADWHIIAIKGTWSKV